MIKLTKENKVILEKVVMKTHTGGSLIVTHDIAGPIIKEQISPTIPPPDLAGASPEQIGTVSVDIEFSRNYKYNKIAISIFARTPCLVGREREQATRIIDILDALADDYSESAIAKLSTWKSS